MNGNRNKTRPPPDPSPPARALPPATRAPLAPVREDPEGGPAGHHGAGGARGEGVRLHRAHPPVPRPQGEWQRGMIFQASMGVNGHFLLLLKFDRGVYHTGHAPPPAPRS